MAGKLIFSVFFLLFFFSAVWCQDNETERSLLKKDIYYLASDTLEGRAPDTKGSKLAAEWIIGRLEKSGLEPFVKSGYGDRFSYIENGKKVRTMNIIACTNREKECRLVLTAHYDHLPMESLHSREVFKNVIHNGADDNASGVALLLLLADYFAKSEAYREYNIVFIFFSGHESGLYGSDSFADRHFSKIKSATALVNFDMVGRMSKAEPQLFMRINEGTGWNIEFPGQDESFKVQLQYNDFQLDHTIFAHKELNAATLSTGMHDDYHKGTDDAEKINFEGMVVLYNYLKIYLSKILVKN